MMTLFSYLFYINSSPEKSEEVKVEEEEQQEEGEVEVEGEEQRWNSICNLWWIE